MANLRLQTVLAVGVAVPQLLRFWMLSFLSPSRGASSKKARTEGEGLDEGIEGMDVEVPHEEVDESGGLARTVAPEWAQSFRNDMKAELLAGVRGVMREELSTLQGQIKEVDITARQALTVATEAKELVESLRKEKRESSTPDAQTLRSLRELEVEFGKLKVEGNLPRSGGGEEVGNLSRRTREMIFKNFKRNTPSASVVEAIQAFIEKSGCQIEEKGVFSYLPMTSFGIGRFANHEEKRKFKLWLADHKPDMKYKGIDIFAEDNEDKEENDKKTAVGKVIRALYMAREGRKDITRTYDGGQVWVGQKIVAKWRNGAMDFKGEGLAIKDSYLKLLDELKQKKQQDTDSE